MTSTEFIEKWTNHLTGRFTYFAFKETVGPGLAERIPRLVSDIERSVRQMMAEAKQINDPIQPNGQVQKKEIPSAKQ